MHILKYFVYYAYFANYAYLCLLIKLALLLCRWPSQKYKYFCPPRAIKDTKRRATDDEGEEKLGALGHDYDILLHFAIAYMRRGIALCRASKMALNRSIYWLLPANTSECYLYTEQMGVKCMIVNHAVLR